MIRLTLKQPVGTITIETVNSLAMITMLANNSITILPSDLDGLLFLLEDIECTKQKSGGITFYNYKRNDSLLYRIHCEADYIRVKRITNDNT